ncbi:MAG: hypothetical protein CMK89_14060 [Pseudomonadales bacterium]|nr:hypothetical protein [Pseudomonadales bacterium]
MGMIGAYTMRVYLKVILGFLMLSTVTLSQALEYFEPLPIVPIYRLEPVYPTGRAGFAMVSVNDTTGEETLQMANLTSLSPLQAEMVNYSMATYDGYSESIVSLIPSPDNRLLAVYSFQFSSTFFDHNVRLYRMSDGALISGGFVNEHGFSVLNKDLWPSQIMEDCLELERSFGVPEATLEQMDYSLDVDDAGEGYSPIIRWHDNNTLSVTIEPEVEVFYNSSGGFPVCNGIEAFTLYLDVTEMAATRDHFGDLEDGAGTPWIYNLAPVNTSVKENITLNGQEIDFRYRLYWNGSFFNVYFPRSTNRVKGNIPRLFRLVPN